MEEHDFSSKIDSITPNPEQLRALTHPIRLRLLGLLRIDGPQTATDLAHRTGLNTGSTSYHLRMLAKYGFIEKDEQLSAGRKLVWRASNTSTVTNTPTRQEADADVQLDAMYGFQQVVAAEYSRQMIAATEHWRTLSPEWQDASTLSDFPMRLTAQQAHTITHKIAALLLDEMRDHPLHSGEPTGHSESDTDTDADTEVFTIQLLGFPLMVAMQDEGIANEGMADEDRAAQHGDAQDGATRHGRDRSAGDENLPEGEEG